MGKYSFTLFFMFLIVLCTKAQDKVQVQATEGISLRNMTEYEIVGPVSNNIILIRRTSDQYYVHAFDKDMKEKWEKTLELDKRPSHLLGTVLHDNHFLFFYRFRKRGNVYIRMRKINANLNMVDSLTIAEYPRLNLSPTHDFIVSQDKSKILFFDIQQEKDIEAIVFDTKTMSVLWHETFSTSGISLYQDFLKAIVDNDGGMHVIAEKDNRRLKKENNRFNVFYYDAIAEKSRQYFVSFSNELWYDVDFEYDNINQQIVAGGIYMDEKGKEGKGYFYMNFNPKSPKGNKLFFHPFEKEFLISFLGKKIKKDPGVTDVIVQEIVLRSDGGMLLIVERNKEFDRQTTTTTRTEDYQQYNTTDYYFDDIMVLSIHPNGDLHWKEILHKKQFSQDDNGIYSSYFLMKTRKSLRFLYNDDIANDNVVNSYTVKGDGDPDRKSIFNTEGKKLKLRVSDALQISANQVIIPSERRQQLKLVLLTY